MNRKIDRRRFLQGLVVMITAIQIPFPTLFAPIKPKVLVAKYTPEVSLDLKAMHYLNTETELANFLSAEILAEINREVDRRLFRNG